MGVKMNEADKLKNEIEQLENELEQFFKVAEAFGCYSERISKKGEIIPALERAAKAGKPALVEIMVQQIFPYTGSPACGWWDVPRPTYLTEKRKTYEEEIKGEKL